MCIPINGRSYNDSQIALNSPFWNNILLTEVDTHVGIL